MKLVIHPTATADIRIPAAHIVVSLRADGMYELSVAIDPEIEVFDPEIEVAIDPEIEVAIDPEVEVDVDGVEHWFSIGCRCEWCDAIRIALENCVYEQPWSCPRCESINNYTSPICEVCDTDISVAHRMN